MQSSYKVIKNFNVVKEGSKEIETKFYNKEEIFQKELTETNARNFIDSYEELAKTMIENARRQSDSILSAAYAEAERIEKEAYEKGYGSGMEQGYADGVNKAYEEGYEKNVQKALIEAEAIKNNADNILNTCIEEKEIYIKNKENEIKLLIEKCIESILKREVKDKEGLNSIVFNAMSEVKNSKTFIIKAKKIYCDEFKNQVDIWKEQLPFKGDIFIVPDEFIQEGSVIIERDNGKIEAGIDIAMEKVREIVYSGE
ncbi:V-type ATPase subunit subunit G family protein [Clostridium sp. DJ247]|uniref:FliH/SctL family protein n=1 Tax=Clostridium sp. DJ247 TaxID=2726188 RepID=UPI001626EFA6|nr:V-type ATPase subunit subunit G family protein [Clostridium sp. DJ247]MBC2582128.1 flagellar assembly protein FliH [Clostridium sp. DJ247]